MPPFRFSGMLPDYFERLPHLFVRSHSVVRVPTAALRLRRLEPPLSEFLGVSRFRGSPSQPVFFSFNGDERWFSLFVSYPI